MEGNSDLTAIEALLRGTHEQRDFWPNLIAANRAGERRGVPSWCTAHPQTLSAVLAAHRDNDEPILIEATCNQVNQEGGYTGMTPADFRRFVEGLAHDAGVDPVAHPRRRPSRAQSMEAVAGGRSDGAGARNGEGLCRSRFREDSSRRQHGLRR